MKALTLGIFLLFVSGCSTHKKITMQYIGQQYMKSQNKSFINNELLFLNGSDTLRMNVKIPFNPVSFDTINNGIYYRCFPKQGSIYTFKLKPIRMEDIPDAVNSYYKINAVFKTGRTGATFTEIKNDTEFIQRNPGKYIDIQHKVYEIIEMWPDKDCAFE